ncbi:hypothetical protein NLX78_16430, partial [Paenibacillus sp. Lou8.1]|uniref:hypothetical protein n=1 Tax=Paenibacillus sp. Lou8.1 TaxID=2962041 RepID=UPI0020B80906
MKNCLQTDISRWNWYKATKETTVGEDGENKVLDCRCFIELTFPVRIPVKRIIWSLHKNERLGTMGLR